ncbi:MAG: AgmX/PglI C-terminal domain-containing protein [Proteobacteria bacterium]|nr:AgmX/PglI C-terminal domain-containing protein [Pseudomonadota bacterium]
MKQLHHVLSVTLVILLSLSFYGCANSSQNTRHAVPPVDTAPASPAAEANAANELREVENIMAQQQKEREAKQEQASEQEDTGVTYILDKAIIHAAVAEHTEDLSNCYANELENTKGLKGTITVSWNVMGDGRVSDAKVIDTTMKNKNVEDCIVDSISKWRFPATGTKAAVDYPFEFESSKK